MNDPMPYADRADAARGGRDARPAHLTVRIAP